MEYDMARTDLAVELNESISKKSGSLKGIIVNESTDSDAEVKVTEIKITNKRAATKRRRLIRHRKRQKFR